MQGLIHDLNRLYGSEPSLHATDARAEGFQWLDPDDAERSVYAFVRQAPGAPRLAIVANMTPVGREHYRLGLPAGGTWREVLNTDAEAYGGGGAGNFGQAMAEPVAAQGQSHSAALYLPPLSVLVFREEE